jgi:hypothetical protein
MVQQSNERSQQDHAARFDKSIQALGEDYAEVLGTGDYASVTTQQKQARQNMYDVYCRQERMFMDQRTYDGRPLPVPSHDELVQQAEALTFIGKRSAQAKAAVAKATTKRASKAIARPTRRTEPRSKAEGLSSAEERLNDFIAQESGGDTPIADMF